MANKRIIDVDVVSTINENDFLFINQQQSLKQIKKSDIPKPSYTADEVGALPKTTKTLPNPKHFVITQGEQKKRYDGSTEVELDLATLSEVKTFLGI